MFRWLNQIDNFDWIPPAILFLSKNLHFPDKLKQFFTNLERSAAGLTILRADINCALKDMGGFLRLLKKKQIYTSMTLRLN